MLIHKRVDPSLPDPIEDLPGYKLSKVFKNGHFTIILFNPRNHKTKTFAFTEEVECDRAFTHILQNPHLKIESRHDICMEIERILETADTVKIVLLCNCKHKFSHNPIRRVAKCPSCAEYILVMKTKEGYKTFLEYPNINQIVKKNIFRDIIGLTIFLFLMKLFTALFIKLKRS